MLRREMREEGEEMGKEKENEMQGEKVSKLCFRFANPEFIFFRDFSKKKLVFVSQLYFHLKVDSI